MSKLISISVKQDDFNLPTPEVLQEQNIAIYDLKQCNFFQLVGFESTNEIKLTYLWLALFPTALGYLTWTYSVGYYGANKASLFLYLIPPISIILNFLWYEKNPSLITIFGGLVILLSVFFTLLLQQNRRVI